MGNFRMTKRIKRSPEGSHIRHRRAPRLMAISSDMLCHAILYLDIHEIKRLSSLCQRLRAISDLALAQVRELFLASKRSDEEFAVGGKVATMILATVWTKCPNLRTATFAGCTFQDVLGTLLSCPKLRELTCDIDNLARIEQMRFISDVARNSPLLERVDLSGFAAGLRISVVPFALHCPGLRHLRLAASPPQPRLSGLLCKKTIVTGFLKVLGKCPDLNELLLIVMKSDFACALKRAGPSPAIERLELVGCSETAKICARVRDFLPNIHVLNLSENARIGDVGVSRLADGDLDIEMLNIYATSHTNYSLVRLLDAKVFPNLAHLSIYSISTDILRRFAVLKEHCKIYTERVDKLEATGIVLNPISYR